MMLRVFFENALAAEGGFDMSYSVVRCGRCGFHYARQLADNATFSAYYNTVSKYDTPGALPPVDQTRIEETVKFLEGRVDKSARIADLWCGYGALLGSLKQARWTLLHGLDPAPNAAQTALEMFDVSGIQRGTMFEAPELLNLQEMDLVCSMSVLEHLPALKQDMAQLLSRLRPGCKVLVEVPALEFFPTPTANPLVSFHWSIFSSLMPRHSQI
jgi:2-polyprenyl-3-methyl-5-hydroxy-6-metoxy-1,4-benzoquinol methylase